MVDIAGSCNPQVSGAVFIALILTLNGVEPEEYYR